MDRHQPPQQPQQQQQQPINIQPAGNSAQFPTIAGQLNPNIKNMTTYLETKLVVSNSFRPAQKEHINNMLTIVKACESAGVELPHEAQYVLQRNMAIAVGTGMGGLANGYHIANCMDANRMGIPPPPTPFYRSNRRFGVGRGTGGNKAKKN